MDQPRGALRTAGRAASLAGKVAAGTLLFMLVLIAVQSRDARIAGMMLTFPALNGISLMLAPVADKQAMARAMLSVIALNGLVGLAFIAAVELVPRVLGVSPAAVVLPLAAAAFVLWLLACWSFGRIGLFAERQFVRGFLVLAPLLAMLWWVACPMAAPAVGGSDSVGVLLQAQLARIALFALTLALVLAVADALGGAHALVGRLGAFPVLPLFSLATIAEAEAASGAGGRLAVVKPAMLLGLLLAMAFAWLYARFLMRLGRARLVPTQWVASALAGLVGGWIVCGVVIYAGMAIVAAFEGCR